MNMDNCSLGLMKGDPGYGINHYWASSREAAKERDGYACVKCGSDERLEVNHIDPRWGKNGSGCQHHQDNMETLCKRCHRLVTASQLMGLTPSDVLRVRVDARKRINLGPWRSPYTTLYTIEKDESGVITLRPGLVITDPEVIRAAHRVHSA